MNAKTQDLAGARWDDVRIFLAVARAGSLGQAAARLAVDTSTVSRRLTALEESLGARLYERTRAGLTATRLGELVLPAAEAMEAAHGRFARNAASAESVPEGVVRLSAAPGLAQDFVAPSLVRLRARFPRLRIELHAAARVLDLTRHEADLALRSVPTVGAERVVTRLCRSRWVAAAAPRAVKALGPLKTWQAVPWIAWDSDMASFHAARWLSRHVPAADVALRTSDFPSQMAAARSGLGAVLAPEAHLGAYGLRPLAFRPALADSVAAWPRDDLWLVGHRALREVPRIAAVWQFLVEELRPSSKKGGEG